MPPGRSKVVRPAWFLIAISLLVSVVSVADEAAAMTGAAHTISYRFADRSGDVERHAPDLLAVSVRVHAGRLRVVAEVYGADALDEFTFSLNDTYGGYAYGNIEHAGNHQGAFKRCTTSYVRREGSPANRLQIETDLQCMRGVDLSKVRLTVRLLRGPVYPDPTYTLVDELRTPWFSLAS